MSRRIRQPCGLCLAHGCSSCMYLGQNTPDLSPSTRSPFAPLLPPELGMRSTEGQFDNTIAFDRSASEYQSRLDCYAPSAASSQFQDFLVGDIDFSKVTAEFNADIAADPSLLKATGDSAWLAKIGRDDSLLFAGFDTDIPEQDHVLGQTTSPQARSTAYSRDDRCNPIHSSDTFDSTDFGSLNIGESLSVHDVRHANPGPSLPHTHRASFEWLNSHLGTSTPYPNINKHYIRSDKHLSVPAPTTDSTYRTPFREYVLNADHNDLYGVSQFPTHESLQHTNQISASVSWNNTQSSSLGAPRHQHYSMLHNCTTIPTSDSCLSFEDPTTAQSEFTSLLGKGKQAISVPQSTQGTSDCETLHKCSECETQLPSKQDLDTHTKSVHRSGYKQCPVDSCPGLFPTPSDMKRHVDEVHHKSKNWPCYYCPKRFGRWYKLRDHMEKMHKDVKDLAQKLELLFSLSRQKT
jgi:hypothetical protein